MAVGRYFLENTGTYSATTPERLIAQQYQVGDVVEIDDIYKARAPMPFQRIRVTLEAVRIQRMGGLCYRQYQFTDPRGRKRWIAEISLPR